METMFNNFINENKKENILPLPIRDEKYQFLEYNLSKCKFENTSYLVAKEPILIGTCGNHELYLNYLDKGENNDYISFWFIYDEQPDELYGTKWKFGVLYEEYGKLVSTDRHDEITLFPNFMDIIYNTFKSYKNLDEWCKTLKEHGEKSRYYHRWAIQKSQKIHNKELTWEEKIDNKEQEIFHEIYFNRHSKPINKKDLDEMLELGEEKYNKLVDERNKRMMGFLKELEDEGYFEDLKNKKDNDEN